MHDCYIHAARSASLKYRIIDSLDIVWKLSALTIPIVFRAVSSPELCMLISSLIYLCDKDSRFNISLI